MHFELGSVLPVQIAIRFRGEIRGVPPPNSEGRGCSWDTVCWEGATLYFCFYILKQNLKAASCCAINILLIVMGTVLFRRKIRWGGEKTNKHAPWREL